MAANYTVYSLDGKTGNAVGELPWVGNLSFEDVLSGAGTCTLRMPLRHAKATRDYLAPGKRELGITRNGVGVWNGPITDVKAGFDGDDEYVDITATTCTWYLQALLFNVAANYKRDQLQIALAVFNYCMSKPNTTYRFTCSNLTSGIVKNYAIGYGDPRFGMDIINDLAAGDPSDAIPDGFDYRVDVTFRSATVDFSRNLRFGYPTLGRDLSLDYDLTVGGVAGLEAAELTENADRSATSWTAMGAGAGKNKLRATATAANYEAVGYPRTERMIQRINIHDMTHLTAQVKHARSIGTPPRRLWTARFRPSLHLPYGTFDLGDKVQFDAAIGYMTVPASTKRVLSLTTNVDETGEDSVTMRCVDPYDAAAI